jgi:hypothetical protein
MAGIATQGNTFNLPNYHGRLISLSPEDTPFLSAIGGLTGGKSTRATEFEWQTYDLRAAGDDRQRLEGANAPTVDLRVRANVSNIVEVHQEAVEVSYTKQAATQQYAGVNNGDNDNPVLDEMAWQIDKALRAKARDVEKTFITGTYQKPTDNTTARKTRGILQAITTNVTAKSGTPTLTATDVLDLCQTIWTAGGIQEQETATLIVGAALKRWISKLFITDKGYAEQTRNVGGVNVQTIETDFGRLNVMLNRYITASTLAIVSLEECAPVFLEIPQKGFLFVEPLAKVGAADKSQLYGEIGLEYGSEIKHGKITGLNTAAPA